MMTLLAHFLACFFAALTALGGVPVAGAMPTMDSKEDDITRRLRPHLMLSDNGIRPCTLDELTPTTGARKLSSGWTDSMVEIMPYDCSCGMTRARYFCPSWGDRTYPMWEAPAAKEGKCAVVSRDKIARTPLPPGSKVLVYGNSHLRQVVEGMMCMSADALIKRDIHYMDENNVVQSNATVGAEVHCRGCAMGRVDFMKLMVEHSCDNPETVADACSCTDDASAFHFENDATLHYYFAGNQRPKRIEQALRELGTRFEDYNMVFANIGNDPRMSVGALLASARAMQRAGVPFFWLSTYDRHGDLERFLSPKDKAMFKSVGARFLPIHDMVEGKMVYNKGHVEGIIDTHFCMPGPSDEISLFLSQLVWSGWFSWSGNTRR